MVEHLSLAGEVAIGAAIGGMWTHVHVMHRDVKSIHKTIGACPHCKKSKVPLGALAGALAVLVLSLATGCKSTIARGEIDGVPFVVRDRRCLMNSGAEVEVPTSKGPLKLKLNSSPNAEALGAVAEGVAKGVVRGVKP